MRTGTEVWVNQEKQIRYHYQPGKREKYPRLFPDGRRDFFDDNLRIAQIRRHRKRNRR
jgi:hypothetical protein